MEHFFGTLVIKEEKSGFVNKSIIVDGQQRLTTTLIFLIALRDNETDKTYIDTINANYLTNNTSTFQDKIKLKQVTNDWDAYRALINHTEVKPGIIKNAYDIFYKLISDLKRTRPEITINEYILAFQRINVAVIFLDERPFKGEDPQIIFETLNSLGKPLTLSDLIRNYVLLNMDSQNQTDIYENIWYPQIELQLKEYTSDFFRDFLQYKTVSSVKAVSDNNTKEIYSIFKDFVEETYSDHKLFIEDITNYVKVYKWIVTEVVFDEISKDKDCDRLIKELLRNIFHDIKSEAFKPFVMGLLYFNQANSVSIRLNDDSLISILIVIRTYLIRRRLSKLTQGENKTIVLLCNRIVDLIKEETNMFNLLSSMSYNVRLPNDDEMKQILRISNFYEDYKQYSKFVLGKIEEHNTKVAVDFRNKKITIEHIMPQTLSDEWKKDLGFDCNEISKKYLHNIGNLILTEFNSEMGNKSFSEKKKLLSTSSLNYRIEILSNDVWDENSIIRHQENMINCFLETFSLPEELKRTSNWNTKDHEVKVFSPLDKDAGDSAEGNKPSILTIEKTKFNVSTWQDVFVRFIKYIHGSEDYIYQYIIENQLELFSKEDTIIKWAKLKKLIEQNDDIKGRYKTYDGLFWNKVKDLSDETLFVHTNISASTCMNRISNIMNKFNMLRDFVIVELK